MSKMYYKGIIEDVRNSACTDQELEVLIDIFTNTVKKTATTLARKAWFDLRDFHGTRDNGTHYFTFKLDREDHKGKDHWRGTFENNGKKLVVFGYLTKD